MANNKNMTEIEHNKKMIEAVSFLLFSEYAKKKFSEKKQYPDFNLKESEEKIEKYNNLINDYKVKIAQLEAKEQRKLVSKTKREINIKAIKSNHLSAVDFLMKNLTYNWSLHNHFCFVEAKKKEDVEISDEKIDNAVVKEYENISDEKLFPNFTDKDIWSNGFYEGAKWYREQLKKNKIKINLKLKIN